MRTTEVGAPRKDIQLLEQPLVNASCNMITGTRRWSEVQVFQVAFQLDRYIPS